jgi:RHS repeat-associated protein
VFHRVVPLRGSGQLNQYTLVGSQACSYDANGNLVSRTGNSGPGGGGGGGGTGSASATYDYRNQMVSWYDVGTGMLATYGYDCIGRRISKFVGGTTTQYVWAGQRVIEERVGGAVQASYAHGVGLDEVLSWRAGTTDRYFATDDMGSVVKLLDATGAVEESYEYGDFGKLLGGLTLQPLVGLGGGSGSAAGNRSFYTGREHDWESGLHQHRARYLEPGVGRFTTRDPIGIWGDASNAGNGYTYAASNPWTYCDPLGLEKFPGCPHPGMDPDDDPFALLKLASYLGPEFGLLLQIMGWAQQMEDARQNRWRYIQALNPISGCGGGRYVRHVPGVGFVRSSTPPAGGSQSEEAKDTNPGHEVHSASGTGHADPPKPAAPKPPPEPSGGGFELGVSLWGMLDAVGGAAEAVAGAALALAGCGGSPAAVAVGTGVLCHGYDVLATGVRQAYTGKKESTKSQSAMRARGASARSAALADALISVVGTIGAARAIHELGKVATGWLNSLGHAGSSSSIRIVEGGAPAAERLFRKLSKGGIDVTPPGYPGKLVRLPNGGFVGYRGVSKSGPPTIDVNIPGIAVRKIKFIE